MEDARERAYKAVAYSAVTFSLLAIVSVCITMPMVYNFVDHIQQQTKRDLSFCKVRRGESICDPVEQCLWPVWTKKSGRAAIGLSIINKKQIIQEYTNRVTVDML